MTQNSQQPVQTDVRDRIIGFLPRLRRFCIAMTGTVDDGDDLVQSTVERALVRIDQWQEGTKLESWMYRIARNIHIDQIRSRKTRGHQVDEDALEMVAGDDGRTITEMRSDLAAAQQAMRALPEDQRTLITLVVIDGQSYRDAADILDIPIGTVMSRLARARKSIDLHVHRGRI